MFNYFDKDIDGEMRLHHRYNSTFKSVSGMYIIEAMRDSIVAGSSGRAGAPVSSMESAAAA